MISTCKVASAGRRHRLKHYVLAAALAVAALNSANAASTAGHQIWVKSLDVPIYNDLRVANGMIYLTSEQPTGPNVFSLSEKSGRVEWKYDTNGSIAIPPTVGPAQVFVASDIGDTHFMRALNAKTGALVWQYTRNQPPECMCSHPSNLESGLLFAQTDGHSLFAFDPAGANVPARRIWQFKGDGAKLTAPVKADGLVVFGSADHDLYALDARTGDTRWVARTGYGFVAKPVIAAGLVIAGNRGGTLHAYSLKTGKSAWTFTTGGPIDTPPIVTGNRLFLASADRTVSAIDLRTGKLRWQHELADYSSFQPVAIGDRLVVADRAGQLVAFDKRTGIPAWSTNLDGTPLSAPRSWDGKIVLKIGDHRVAAYSTVSGKLEWQYRQPAVVTAPALGRDAVYVATSTGKIVALH